MKKISIAMITHNSEKHLQKSLESVADWVDEIIIVDQHSTDNTQEIAKKYNARVFKEEWKGFARQKNSAIKKARNNWILSLDSDELVDSDLKKEIVENDFDQFDCAYIARRNYIGKKLINHSNFYPDWQLRLFRKDKTMFADLPVHEQVEPKGKVKYLKGHIIHYTYENNKQYLEKVKRYSELDARFLFSEKRPWNIVYQYGKPIKEFFYRYFSQKGILDGYEGLVIATYSAYGRYLAAKYLKELYNKKK